MNHRQKSTDSCPGAGGRGACPSQAAPLTPDAALRGSCAPLEAIPGSPGVLGICAPFLEYLENATPEPEKVWACGLRLKPQLASCGRRERFTTEVAAWRGRSRKLAGWPGSYTVERDPFSETVPEALAKPASGTTPIYAVILRDEQGREVKRWVLE